MKKTLLVILSVMVLASCSAPKYSYKFSYHDYNAGRKDKQVMKEVAANPGPVEVQPEMLVAEAPVVAPEAGVRAEAPAPVTKSAPLTVSKSEKKGLVKDVKQMIKQVKHLKKGDTVQTDKATKMDADLKMALIFLIGSVISSILGTIALPELFYILGAVLIIVAIIYFVRWLMRQ